MARAPEIVNYEEWYADVWHGVLGKARRWKLTEDGILLNGDTKPRRTKGAPKTIERIATGYGGMVRNATRNLAIAETTVIAMIANESGGKLPADRYEPHIKDWSFGLCQTITATARAVGAKAGRGTQLIGALPQKPIPKGGSKDRWKTFLDDPLNSIRLGAWYLDDQDRRLSLQGDPLLQYASYNAGGVYASSKNPWGVRYYGKALDHYLLWFNDACAVYGAAGL
jgi:soluble lytic murein transglycosylase-like protein